MKNNIFHTAEQQMELHSRPVSWERSAIRAMEVPHHG
jgi:hypothetical protein